MSTEPKKRKRGGWLAPVLLALPFLAATALAAVFLWPVIMKYITVILKAVVVS